MFWFFSNSTKNEQALKEAIEQGAFLVDVRTPAEFAAGSVPGAVNIPLDQIHLHLNAFKDKSTIVVFCRSGARSGQAKSFLEKNGIANVLNGGGWEEVYSVVKSMKS